MRTIKIYPHPKRLAANPNYRVRDPHYPQRLIPVEGATVPLSGDVARLIRCGDVETEDDRAARLEASTPEPEPEAKPKTKGR